LESINLLLLNKLFPEDSLHLLLDKVESPGGLLIELLLVFVVLEEVELNVFSAEQVLHVGSVLLG